MNPITARAALLPHPADPFMLNYWLKFFNEVWQDEVDRLYICINSPMERPVIDYMLNMCYKNSKIVPIYLDMQMEHGEAIDIMLGQCQEKYIMLIEDDGFVFQKGYIDSCFKAIESGEYDVVGSARGSCTNEILDQAKVKWDLDYSGMGDVGPNFWPCYFFARKELLFKTDRKFGARKWNSGEKIEGLDYVCQEDQIGDTFVSTSLQIRGMVPKARIMMVPQYHGSPDDVEHYDRKFNLFDGRAAWTHVGSLSSGTHGVLIDDAGRALGRRTIDPPKASARLGNYCNTEQEKREWERRVQWWLKFVEYYESGTQDDAIAEFRDAYKIAIDRIISQYGLSMSNIRKRQRIYNTLGL